MTLLAYLLTPLAGYLVGVMTCDTKCKCKENKRLYNDQNHKDDCGCGQN